MFETEQSSIVWKCSEERRRDREHMKDSKEREEEEDEEEDQSLKHGVLEEKNRD